MTIQDFVMVLLLAFIMALPVVAFLGIDFMDAVVERYKVKTENIRQKGDKNAN